MAQPRTPVQIWIDESVERIKDVINTVEIGTVGLSMADLADDSVMWEVPIMRHYPLLIDEMGLRTQLIHVHEIYGPAGTWSGAHSSQGYIWIKLEDVSSTMQLRDGAYFRTENDSRIAGCSAGGSRANGMDEVCSLVYVEQDVPGQHGITKRSIPATHYNK